MKKYIVEVYEHVTYWKNEKGQLHRLGGLPAIERADGHKAYWENGELHRLGGLPAIEYTSGGKSYYENGLLHRLGGLPAIEWANGYKEYWIDGKQITEAEAKKLAEPDLCADKVVTIEGRQYKLTPVK